jgi:ribulose-5-phosphate 4-epimerase/fuculose-1-phosphate aldolase
MNKTLNSKEDLVIACQALALHGCGAGIGGHVSIRVPGENALWINAFDRTLAEVTADDVLMIDFEGNLLDGNREISIGYEFHPGIYQKRQDVNAIVHTHGFWGTALAGLARPLKIRHNLSCFFHNDQALSPDDSFASIGPAIGNANTIIIPWHGCITVGTTIGRAAALHVTLEDMAKLDVMLEPSGAPELPIEWRDQIKDLIDSRAGYLEQTWNLMHRQISK